MSKNNLREIALRKGPIWGINSLTLYSLVPQYTNEVSAICNGDSHLCDESIDSRLYRQGMTSSLATVLCLPHAQVHVLSVSYPCHSSGRVRLVEITLGKLTSFFRRLTAACHNDQQHSVFVDLVKSLLEE